MHIEQPPPDAVLPERSIFHHLRPALWQRSKVAHITLVSVGTLMLLPAGFVFVMLIQVVMLFGGSSGLFAYDREIILPLVTAVGSSCLGVLAWSALCMLFFKRTDARWQRFCWGSVAAFGIVAAPCTLGWHIWVGSQTGPDPDIAWMHLVFLLLLAATVASIVLGIRYSRAAHKELQQAPPADQAAYYG